MLWPPILTRTMPANAVLLYHVAHLVHTPLPSCDL